MAEKHGEKDAVSKPNQSLVYSDLVSVHAAACVSDVTSAYTPLFLLLQAANKYFRHSGAHDVSAAKTWSAHAIYSCFSKGKESLSKPTVTRMSMYPFCVNIRFASAYGHHVHTYCC